jgi:hypothetical protein
VRRGVRGYSEKLQERVGAVALEPSHYLGGFNEAGELSVEPKLQINEGH